MENFLSTIIDFIDKYWSLNHILVKDRVLLDWQYKNEDDSYNFVIARFKNEIIEIWFLSIPISPSNAGKITSFTSSFDKKVFSGLTISILNSSLITQLHL